MNRIWLHLKLICRHKWFVFFGCCRCGITWQGLIHDLSKFSLSEFIPSVRYYQGTNSPVLKERQTEGYSAVFLHHKGCNKHHYEYWIEFREDGSEKIVRMPIRYVKEMLCDWIAAGKAYNGKNWTPKYPMRYYLDHQSKYRLHPDTKAFVENILLIYDEQGEDAAMKILAATHDYPNTVYPKVMNYEDTLVYKGLSCYNN